MSIILTLVSLFFLVTGPVYSATKSADATYPITSQNVKINQHEYDRYLKPQLKSMMSEFFKVLSIEREESSKFFPLRKDFLDIKEKTKNLITFCAKARPLESCDEAVQEILKDWRVLESGIYKLEKSFSHFSGSADKSSNFLKIWELSYYAKTRNKIHDLALGVTKNMNQLENIELNLKLGIFDLVSYKKLIQDNFNLRGSFDLIIWKMMIPDRQELVENVWANFFQKVESHILNGDGMAYLQSNLETLNFNWNLFHMQMAKGNIKPGPKILGLLQTVHRRWNSILKIVLN